MKKDILKLAVAFLFIGITGTYTVTLNAMHINSSQKQFINRIATKLEGFISFTTNWTDEFFNKANKESYNIHVDRMKAKIVEFEREIVNPVKNQHAGADDYGRVVIIIKSVITRVHDQARDVYSILDRHRGSSALKLGLAFRAVKKYNTRTAVNQLENQLKEIQQLLRQMDSELAEKINTIIARVEKQLQKNDARGDWEAFQALRHRFACTDQAAEPATQKALATTIVASATPRQIRQATIQAKRAARERENAQKRAQNRSRL